jgi:hypothetical protein|tara:strand:+ start:13365 stop:13526 length:162 start_codon:yes stop_codon:yes gene_type:complete
MAVKEIMIKRKGNVVFKKNININMSGKGIRASKPRGGVVKLLIGFMYCHICFL